MIEVYNVGQGDSFLLKPNCKCIYQENPILIDCGHSKYNVYKKIMPKLENILITHSHEDHLNGLEKLIKFKNITNLFLPYYLPEILAILNYFEKKQDKKIKILSKILLSDIQLSMLKAGDNLCSHIEIFNPIVENDIFDGIEISDEKVKSAIINMNKILNLSLSIDEILNYRSDILPYLDSTVSEEYHQKSKTFLHKFIYNLNLAMLQNKLKPFLSAAKQKIKYDANKFSIVLKYKDENISYLFTGDADTTVFNKIIRDNKSSLQSDILKVPHHGSACNINDNIIKYINPKYAIISHGNQHGHPSEKVIKWLEDNGTTVFLTNDIAKVSYSLKTTKQRTGSAACNEIVFIQ